MPKTVLVTLLTVEQPGSNASTANMARQGDKRGDTRRPDRRSEACARQVRGPRRIEFILSVSPIRGRAESSDHVLLLRQRAINAFGISGNHTWRAGL